MSTYVLPEPIRQITDFREMVTDNVDYQKTKILCYTVNYFRIIIYDVPIHGISSMEYQDKFKETEIMSPSDKDMLYPTLVWVKAVLCKPQLMYLNTYFFFFYLTF